MGVQLFGVVFGDEEVVAHFLVSWKDEGYVGVCVLSARAPGNVSTICLQHFVLYAVALAINQS